MVAMFYRAVEMCVEINNYEFVSGAFTYSIRI